MTSRLLLRLLIGGTLIASAHGALIGVLPVYLEDSGEGPRVIGVVVGAYAVTMAVARLATGRAFNRVAPSRLLLLAGLLMSVAYAGYLVIDAGVALVLPRLLHGVAWGLYSVTAFSWIARRSSESERGRSMGLYGIGTSIALVVMPAAGVGIYEARSADLVFAVGLASSLGVVVLALLLPHESFAATGAAADGEPSWLGRVLLVVFLASATTGLLEAFMPKLAEARHVGSLATVYACFGLALGAGRFGGGTASDRWGRPAVTATGLVAVSLTFVLMSVVDGTLQMSAVAVIYGLGLGGAMTALTADVADRSAGERQSRALGAAAFLNDVGVAGGAVVGGTLAARSITTLNTGGFVLGAAAMALLAFEIASRRGETLAPATTLVGEP